MSGGSKLIVGPGGGRADACCGSPAQATCAPQAWPAPPRQAPVEMRKSANCVLGILVVCGRAVAEKRVGHDGRRAGEGKEAAI